MNDQSKAKWLLGLVVLTALALRLAVMSTGSGRFDDPDNYLPLARSIAAGDGLTLRGRPTAYRPPLYPLILAPLAALSGERLLAAVAGLHLLLGAATAGLTFRTAERLGVGTMRATAAGLIVACDPVLVWQARFVMTETLAAFLLVAALAEFARGGRWSPCLAGGILGLAGLCRPSALPGAGLTVLAALIVPPGAARERFRRGAGVAIGLVVVLSPWVARNAWVFGEPVWTTTHGGYTLALGNNEVYYRDVLEGPPGRVWTGRDQWLWWDSVNKRTAGMSEPEADRLLRNSVVELARSRPRMFLRACLARLATFWSAVPAEGVYGRATRLITGAWTIPLWTALVLGAFHPRFRRWPGVAVPMAIVGLSVVHTLYWTDMRMRAPIVPAIALVAASAWWKTDQRASAVSCVDSSTTGSA
ncbi:MAG: dolichyl-phosphate-mannose-protein mannosyltransferase [Paludisphaera borealis]|uniref:ArnT family glycosyltransferase n=1 Tax=Paludisphaera borealis TaxID=1387353 RepID=UPI0028417C44|nr:dolichyl-phosphate-mannose-protein mannosyltransferase [Paludisphaera borealis]MDR3618564.1 dolichyl-phosphate-mannose-protein mannosyltransferase [Paludisphaera borealis]